MASSAPSATRGASLLAPSNRQRLIHPGAQRLGILEHIHRDRIVLHDLSPIGPGGRGARREHREAPGRRLVADGQGPLFFKGPPRALPASGVCLRATLQASNFRRRGRGL